MTEAQFAQLQAIHAQAGSLQASVEALMMSFMAPPPAPAETMDDAPRTFGRKKS